VSARPATRSAPLGALLAVALGACAPPPPRAPLTAVELTVSPQEAPPPPPTPEPTIAAEPAAAPATAPAMVAVAPPGAGCKLTGRRVFAPSGPGLLLALPAGPLFAVTVPSPAAVKITATFPEGDVIGPGVAVELDDDHVVVRGVARTVDLRVAPRSLFTLGDALASGDFVAPVGDVLVVENVVAGTATVAVWIGNDISLVNGGLRAQRRCNELQLDAQRVDAGTVARFVTGKPPAGQRARAALSVDRETPLSSARGEAPSVLLRTAEAPAEVEVIERRGREARVFWYHDGYALFGWVPASKLHKETPGAVAAPPGAVAAAPPAPPGLRPLVCRSDVPLFVALGATHTEVGAVRKDTPMLVRGEAGGFLLVELRDVAFAPDRGAEWALRALDLARVCVQR
jgi:hypothetical protein